MKETDITNEWLKDFKAKSTHCALCGDPMNEIKWHPKQKHLDHVIPLNKKCFGLHVMRNVRYICRQCNIERPKDGSDLLK